MASLALSSGRHISISAHAMNACRSRKLTAPWEWEEEDLEPIYLLF